MKELRFLLGLIGFSLLTFILVFTTILLISCFIHLILNLVLIYEFDINIVFYIDLGFSIASGMMTGISYYMNNINSYDFNFNIFKVKKIKDLNKLMWFIILNFLFISNTIGLLVCSTLVEYLEYVKKWTKLSILYGVIIAFSIFIIKELFTYFLIKRKLRKNE